MEGQERNMRGQREEVVKDGGSMNEGFRQQWGSWELNGIDEPAGLTSMFGLWSCIFHGLLDSTGLPVSQTFITPQCWAVLLEITLTREDVCSQSQE